MIQCPLEYRPLAQETFCEWNYEAVSLHRFERFRPVFELGPAPQIYSAVGATDLRKVSKEAEDHELAALWLIGPIVSLAQKDQKIREP